MSQAMPALGANQQFCPSCGQIISSAAPTCPHCGAPTGVKIWPPGASPKLRLVALLLCWFFGISARTGSMSARSEPGYCKYSRWADWASGRWSISFSSSSAASRTSKAATSLSGPTDTRGLDAYRRLWIANSRFAPRNDRDIEVDRQSFVTPSAEFNPTISAQARPRPCALPSR